LDDILSVLSDDEEDEEENKEEEDDEDGEKPKNYFYNDDCSSWRQRYHVCIFAVKGGFHTNKKLTKILFFIFKI
jgi:hypothetical protein